MAKERKQALLLLGPIVAVVCIGVAIVANPGSSIFILAVAAAVAFMAVPPVIQVGLLATERFCERYLIACAAGMGVAIVLLIPVSLSVFRGY